jgi:hypothetical protein
MKKLTLILCAAALVACGLTSPAAAQEPINSPAATQPSTGRWVLRNQFQYLEAREDPRTGDRDFREFTGLNLLTYGIQRDLSISALLPVKYRRMRDGATGDRESDFGIGDVTAQLKWRIHQHDFGPIDTSRFSIIAGLQIPTFVRPFSTESVNPMIGGVYTHVQGRHGFNVSGVYKFNTGTGTEHNIGGGNGKADALFYDASYLYRVSPAVYTAETLGAWYGVVEFNGIYETNGDNELFIAPGIVYEARTWTIEASVQLPIWQDLDNRAETRFRAVVGLRLLF